jgi:type II secretory pathway component PulM
MDPASAGSDFGRLMQYGAVGVVAAGLLTLVVVLFRQFVNHALEQNKELQTQHHEMQVQHLQALHAIAREIREVKTELSRDIGQLFNEVSSITDGSRAHRGPRLPPRSGGSG